MHGGTQGIKKCWLETITQRRVSESLWYLGIIASFVAAFILHSAYCILEGCKKLVHGGTQGIKKYWLDTITKKMVSDFFLVYLRMRELL